MSSEQERSLRTALADGHMFVDEVNEPDAEDDFETTMLFECVEDNAYERAKIFLEFGASVTNTVLLSKLDEDSAYGCGVTSRSVALACGPHISPKMLQLLADNGLDMGPYAEQIISTPLTTCATAPSGGWSTSKDKHYQALPGTEDYHYRFHELAEHHHHTGAARLLRGGRRPAPSVVKMHGLRDGDGIDLEYTLLHYLADPFQYGEPSEMEAMARAYLLEEEEEAKRKEEEASLQLQSADGSAVPSPPPRRRRPAITDPPEAVITSAYYRRTMATIKVLFAECSPADVEAMLWSRDTLLRTPVHVAACSDGLAVGEGLAPEEEEQQAGAGGSQHAIFKLLVDKVAATSDALVADTARLLATCADRRDTLRSYLEAQRAPTFSGARKGSELDSLRDGPLVAYLVEYHSRQEQSRAAAASTLSAPAADGAAPAQQPFAVSIRQYLREGRPSSSSCGRASVLSSVRSLMLSAMLFGPAGGGSLGQTTLHLAASARCLASVRLLLAEGADVNRRNAVGRTCLHAVFFESVLPHFNSDNANRNPLYLANNAFEEWGSGGVGVGGDDDEARAPPPPQPMPFGIFRLEPSIFDDTLRRKCADVMQMLLDNGADVDVRCNRGWSAIATVLSDDYSYERYYWKRHPHLKAAVMAEGGAQRRAAGQKEGRDGGEAHGRGGDAEVLFSASNASAGAAIAPPTRSGVRGFVSASALYQQQHRGEDESDDNARRTATVTRRQPVTGARQQHSIPSPFNPFYSHACRSALSTIARETVAMPERAARFDCAMYSGEGDARAAMLTPRRHAQCSGDSAEDVDDDGEVNGHRRRRGRRTDAFNAVQGNW